MVQNSFKFLFLKIKMSLYLTVQESILHKGVSLAAKKEKEGQSTLLPPAVSQVPLIQNNQCAKMAYFGMTISELLQKK